MEVIYNWVAFLLFLFMQKQYIIKHFLKYTINVNVTYVLLINLYK